MNNRRLDDFLHALGPSRGERLWYGGTTLLGALRGVSPEQAVTGLRFQARSPINHGRPTETCFVRSMSI